HLLRFPDAMESPTGLRHEPASFPKEISESWRRVQFRNDVELIAIEAEHDTVPGLADAHRVLQHGLENRLQLARGTRYDTQHIRSRSLLLQRFGELARARLHFVEQPDVFDCDDSLVGESLDKRDLLVIERLRAATRGADHTNHPVLSDHGRKDRG